MDLMRCIKSRRSVRKFLSIPVEKAKLGTILDAGRYAPSAGNLQNWRFIIITDQTHKRQVADSCYQQYWIGSAPVIIVVVAIRNSTENYYGQRGQTYSIMNCAAAIQNMLLASYDQGLGACWVSAFDLESLKRATRLPDEAEPQAVIPIGYADERTTEPPRFELETVTFLETYGSRFTDWNEVFQFKSVNLEKGIKRTGEKIFSITK